MSAEPTAGQAVTDYPLCVADDATFWPWLPSPAFASWPDRERTLVVLPLAGLADWGLGHALDAEETILLHVLAEASRRRPTGLRLLVAPPLRFNFGADPGCAFALEAPVAHAQLAEIVGSIVASGFGRIVLFNASPWNEELCASASRDLRLAHGARIFRIHLSGLGLDLHPVRSGDRRTVQTLITALTGGMPEPAASGGEQSPVAGWGCERVAPLAGAPVPLDRALVEGRASLEKAARSLVALLEEIAAFTGRRA